MSPLLIIGRHEWVTIAEFGMAGIPAKVDTGAYTSSIHCAHSALVEDRLEFILLDKGIPGYTGKTLSTSRFKKKKVKNSFGQTEERFIITTEVEILGKSFKADFSLSNRSELRFPILLGRKMLKKRFLVDVSKKFISKNIL